MSQTDSPDRRPRELTHAELQACWVHLLDDPVLFAKFLAQDGTEEVLPAQARYQSDDHALFPPIRTAYDHQPANSLATLQIIRTFKLNIIRDVITNATQDHFNPDLKYGVFRRSFKEWIGDTTKPLPSPEACVEKCKVFKEQGNQSFAEHQWLEALGLYAQAWGSLLPYHVFAFPHNHERTLPYALLENWALNNILATCLALVRHVKDLDDSSKYHILSLAFRCGTAITNAPLAQQLENSTMLKASRRILEVDRQLKGYPQFKHSGLTKALLEHFYFMVDFLKDKPAGEVLLNSYPQLEARFRAVMRA